VQTKELGLVIMFGDDVGFTPDYFTMFTTALLILDTLILIALIIKVWKLSRRKVCGLR
jgi:hypothetical protein